MTWRIFLTDSSQPDLDALTGISATYFVDEQAPYVGVVRIRWR